MATLEPVSGPLIDTNMLDFVSATVTAVGFLQVDLWEWDITPIGDAKMPVEDINFSFQPVGDALTVSYFSDIELFPLRFIDYVTPSMELVRVYRWEDLPEPYLSPEIIAALPNAKNVQEWNLQVTATGLASDGTEFGGFLEATVTENYRITIFADFSSLGPILRDELDKRRFFQ